MTTLYKPVQIETAEQAEALPTGTYVIAMAADDPYCWCKTAYGTFVDHLAGDGELSAGEIAGPDITALVPIEAEEEYAVRLGSEGGMILPVSSRDPAPGHGGVDNLPRMTRHVTPWIPKEQA